MKTGYGLPASSPASSAQAAEIFASARPQAALDAAGIPWEMAAGGESERVVEATVAADLAVSVRMLGNIPEVTAAIAGDNVLPALGQTQICLYSGDQRRDEVIDCLLSELRCAYSC